MIQRQDVEPPDLRPVVLRLARHWTEQEIEFVRNFDNLVYRLPGPPVRYLRITSTRHRTKDQIASELAVVRHAAGDGLCAARPVPSREGFEIHTLDADGGSWSACVFETARGEVFEPGMESPEAFRCAGRTMARLHRSLDSFRPGPDFTRFEWTGDRWSRFDQFVPASEKEAHALFDELQAWTAGLPAVPPQFGFIHGDFTVANLRFALPEIGLFDFDSCCRHWRAYEMAAFLHYFGGRAHAARRAIYDAFLDGYQEILPATPELRRQIPRFAKMRLLYSFLVFAEEWGFRDLDPGQEAYFALRRRLFGAPSVWPE
jgi:Ser/Thr protein kinase RdoA (MazF antagonist)